MNYGLRTNVEVKWSFIPAFLEEMCKCHSQVDKRAALPSQNRSFSVCEAEC
jgi:hypothetical protein